MGKNFVYYRKAKTCDTLARVQERRPGHMWAHLYAHNHRTGENFEDQRG